MTGWGTLARGRSGTTAIEFALVAAVFIPLCLAMFEAGLLFWTKSALQTAASLTARCWAITSADCVDVKQFAATTAGNWVFPGVVRTTGTDVVLLEVCIGGVKFKQVTVTSRYWTALPLPFLNTALTAVDYFPMAAPPC